MLILFAWMIPTTTFAQAADESAEKELPKAAQTVLGGLDKAAVEGAGFDKEATDISSIVAGIVNAVMAASGIVFLILIVYGGLLYMIAGGQEDSIKKAKRILTSGIIGLIIITASYAISFYILEKLATATGESIVSEDANK